MGTGRSAALSGAIRRDMRVTALDIRNSGDTRGKDRVVGYGASAMEHADSARLDDATRGQLLEVARGAWSSASRRAGRRSSDRLDVARSALAMRACFVSLKIDGQLRGCIGSVIPHRPLVSDVVENAFKASSVISASADYPEELAKAHLEISVLSHARPLHSRMKKTSPPDPPDVDGRFFMKVRTGAFPPQCLGRSSSGQLFIRNLKHKAGLSAITF